jgi:hypothetical protein
VVLSASGPVKGQRAQSNLKWAARVGRLPVRINRTLLRTIVRLALRNVTADRQFWRDFYFRAIAATSRDDLVAQYVLSAASTATARLRWRACRIGGDRC